MEMRYSSKTMALTMSAKLVQIRKSCKSFVNYSFVKFRRRKKKMDFENEISSSEDEFNFELVEKRD